METNPDTNSVSRPSVARFAIAGPVLPRFTDVLRIGGRARHFLMGCSRKSEQEATGQPDANAAVVFSGKQVCGSPLNDSHSHAHFLCEAREDGHIAFLNVVAPMGFTPTDEAALSRFTRMYGDSGHDLQLVLLGLGHPDDFGGLDEKRGQSRILATSTTWVSRTPFVPNRHLKLRLSRAEQQDQRQLRAAMERELISLVRLELARRHPFSNLADDVIVDPLLAEPGTMVGRTFTNWLKFARTRSRGGGRQSSSDGYGFRLTFPIPVSGPIALGYGCHYGLGQFSASDGSRL